MPDLKSDKSGATPKCLPFTKILWQLGIIMKDNTGLPLLAILMYLRTQFIVFWALSVYRFVKKPSLPLLLPRLLSLDYLFFYYIFFNYLFTSSAFSTSSISSTSFISFTSSTSSTSLLLLWWSLWWSLRGSLRWGPPLLRSRSSSTLLLLLWWGKRWWY